ncbi:hemolysin-III related-domain-containing protein [Multifurca ochricompacta]|uniref:Hemolysin-III related-domain-containing protein n=1 Tax=Multifurca ochricompacta TaxID=376703 RepID=A0AAD4M9A5_9AGAM|nr:hemolysin-III related-domain-containing protein [Multifurca ochricompacta]
MITTTATMSPVSRTRRRQSTIHSALSPRMTSAAFASLHLSVLSCLADIEHSLSQLESPLHDFDLGQAICKSELKVDEVRAWARDGLEILKQIKAELRSHLPEFNIDSTSVETYVSSCLHDLSDSSSLKRVTSCLPELPRLPRPENYISTVSNHLKSLHSHLSASNTLSHMTFPSFPSTAKLSELIDMMITSDRLPAVLRARAMSRTEDALGKVAIEVARAIERSLHGGKLITYGDLPMEWRNNPFVTYGYRFIPLSRWHLIIASIFALHNETLNIHTHLIPFLLWTSSVIFTCFGSSIPSASAAVVDTPILAFTIFALFTLFSSVVWHTMAGCAHHRGMVICAKIDYVGIAWLISGTVGTVVYYGFQCNTQTRSIFLIICLINGLAGTVIPFWDWFNSSENKKWRITIFLSMTFSITLGPLVQLALLHSARDTFAFIRPVIPSLASYVAGLLFYATRFPECVLPVDSPRLAWLGGGSHALWHIFIVWAISLHRDALPVLKDGVLGATTGICPLLAE